jgi:hypothetical protein
MYRPSIYLVFAYFPYLSTYILDLFLTKFGYQGETKY